MKAIRTQPTIRLASRWCLPLAMVVGVVVGAGPSWATHYPPGSYCYDCHTISESKMIVGTRLIKKSQKAIDLGISSGAEVPCLFCHEKNAVSVAPRTVMMDVWSHFDTSVRSKHPVDIQSTSGGNPSGLDCVDCHTGITATVVGDGTGNASIHGVDASSVTLDPYSTLISDTTPPANAGELSAKTCQASACHDTDGGGVGDYDAPPAHGTANGITLNDAGAPTGCTDCHGKHYSADGDRLLVLLNTSGANGNAPTNATVQADECEVCHDADDGGAASDWMAHGHGGSTYQAAAIGLNCVSCHDAAKPHDWTGTDKRFSLPADAAASIVTGKSMLSVCTNCHQTLTAHRGQAGCIDCHDPHGKGVGTNIEMVRQQIPVASPTDTVSFTVSGEYDPGAGTWNYYSNNNTGASGSSTGICDNADCHTGVTNASGTAVFPFATYMGTASAEHGGGLQAPGDNCNGCHKHGEASGSWNVSTAVCGTCHGYPPSSSDPYADNPDAVGVHDTHANGLGLSCSECHFGNTHNQSGWSSNTGSPVNPANVDVAFGSRNPSGTYDKATNTCSNLTCHNPDSPTIGLTSRNVATTNAPQWLDGFTAINACTDCHGLTTSGDTHYKHENPAARNYPCQTCHSGENSATNSYSGGHADGALTDPSLVSFDLSQAGLTVAVPNPYDNALSECSNVYCHGASLTTAGGSDTTPQWGTASTGACGACHDTDTTDSTPATYISGGNHVTHLASAWGPAFGTTSEVACGNCHAAYALNSAAHVDGTKDFLNLDGSTLADLTATDKCDNCHSTATVNTQVGRDLAKTNWANGTYKLDCLTCHNGADPATNNADGTGRTAPDMLGDDTAYGAEVTGHNRPTGQYPVSANTAANKLCTDCHDTTTTHLNNADDTTYAGNRLAATVNTVATGTTVSGLCGACHQSTAGAPANAQVSTHGNTNATFQAGTTHDANAEDFGYNCEACHEPHGMTLNGRTATSTNVYMMRGAVEVKNYATPGTGADRTTTAGIVFEAKTGANSFDDGATPADNLCVACHVDAARPGSGTSLTNAAGDGTHAGLSEYNSSEQGNDCTSCHSHNYDTDAGGTVDGFMPAGCDTCHGYPPATNAHDKHVNVLAIDCARCHQNAGTHNESNVTGAADYASRGLTAIRQNVDVVFDTFNPNGTYSQAKGSRTGLGDGTCSVLYCHGADAPFPTATMGGFDTTPVWNTPGTGACGTCHLDTNDTWNGKGSNRHQTHVGTVGAYDFGCDLCHYATTTDGATVTGTANHVNGLADVAFSATDPRLNTTLAPVSTYTGDNVVGSGYGTCDNTYCHSRARDLVPPFEDAPFSAAMTWDNVSGSCSDCHDGPLGGGPNYADGTLVDGNPKANKHQKHRINGTGCASCHGWFSTNFNTFHVNGQYDPTGGTNNTLDTFTFTAGGTGGGINGSCSSVGCHGGNNVAWADTGPFTCDICHGEAGGAVTNTDVNDFAIGMQTAGSVISNIGAAEFTGVGHGGKGLACAGCHDSAVSHDSNADLSGTNPFRLVDQDAGTAGVQFSCSYNNAACHQGTTAGGLDYQSIVPHTDEAMATAGYTAARTWPAWNPDCVNCHDPHGDGSNLSMIQRELYDKAAFNVPAGPPPAEPTEQTALAFTDNTTGASAAGTSYADLDTPFSSVCQECHEAADHVSFKDDATAAGANHPSTGGNPGDCSTCHQHDSAFKPSGCNGCHGSTVTGQYWPDGAGGNPAYVDDSAGAHDNHVLAIGQYLGYGDFNTTMYTDAQQTTICAFCHPNPGGGGHNTDSGDQRVDLYGGTGAGDYYRTFTVGAGVFGDDTGGTAYVYGTTAQGTCQNLQCHNQVDSPTWNTPPDWSTGLTANCSNTSCHASTTYASGSHNRHVDATTKNYDCAECHVANGTDPAHQNGQVDMEFTTAGTLEATTGAGDGFYDKDATGTSTAGDTGFAYKATAGATCYGIYCHGGDALGAGGTDQTPTWGTAATGACGTCHDDLNPGTNGHPTHLTAVNGPQAACSDCHTGSAVTDATHVDGTKTFLGAVALASTAACDTCHNGSAATAKSEWPLGAGHWLGTTGGYCEHCHDATPSTVNTTAGTGGTPITAPQMMGDGTNYGAAVNGHSLASGNFTGSGNPAANKTCTVCHDATAAHIDGTDGTTIADDRFAATINGVAVGAATQVEQICAACHQNTGADQGQQVSTHGNTSASFQSGTTHDANAENFAYRCDGCHEPHGKTLNSRTPGTNVNIYMVKPSVEVKNYSTPGTGADQTTVIPVVFEARTGTYSLDDGNTTPLDSMCVVCHQSASRPGSGTSLTNAAGDGTHTGLTEYANNEQGNHCTNCHQHNYDADAGGTVDGFMPLQCNSCHTYPGLAIVAGTHTLSATHNMHAGEPGAAGATNYKFTCQTCHYLNNHNQSGVTSGANWTANFLASNVNLRFDPGRNPGSPTYAGANASTASAPGVGGTGTCAGLTCHGDTLTSSGGAKTQPAWNVTTDGDCGNCHDTDSADTTPGTSIGSGNHTTHLTALYGPKATCTDCHADPTNFTTHNNGSVSFADGNEVLLGTIAADGVVTNCDTCHNGSAATAKSEWAQGPGHWLGTTGGYCEHCHDATPSTVNTAAGTGGVDRTAPNKTANFTTRGHGLASGSVYPWSSARNGANAACTDCHDAVSAHISAASGDTDRLSTSGNALCEGCHDGAGAGSAVTQVSTHANTSSTMGSVYTAQETSFELNCVECHDVHGTTNIFMVNTTNPDGPLVATRTYGGAADTTTLLFNGTVAFTDDSTATSATSGVGYAQAGAGNATKICQTCHTATGHYQFDSDNGHITTDCTVCHKHDIDDTFASNSQDGFMPSGCNGCHGYPPVPAARAGEGGNTDYVAENYTGGGGKHIEHVEFLKAQTGNSTDVKEICGPCHGDGAGSTDHQGSGQAAGAWAIANRAFVNIRSRAQSSWDGMTGDPLSATYGGNAVSTTGTTPPGNAVDATDSRCAGVDCHGNPATTEPVYWNADMTDTATYNDGLTKSQVCEGCHDETPAEVRVYNAAGTGVYTGSAPDPAASYYGTLSGYSRGGHGDATINSTNDPSFVDSAPSYTTPLDCTACHDNAVAHFPEPATGNIHRLANTTLETTSHTGLCNDCHAAADYPGNHHPSYEGTLASSTTDVIPAAGQQIYTSPSTWTDQGGGHYEQNGYSASGASGNADFFTDWWGGNPGNANQDPPPQPSPLAVLPLERYVLDTGTSSRVMCVTCHNPHGTDLYTYDTLGGHQSVPDNNMLRLRDSDNTLCNACH